MKIYIGSVKIGSRAVMAPVAGFTDAPFRRIVMEQGAGLVYSELLSANAITRGSAKTLAMAPEKSGPRPVAVQIFGDDPGIMAESARVIEETECDIIDLNFGCPVKKVVRTGAGAAILKDPRKAGRITRAVVRAVKKPVTVKIRSGWSASTINAVEVAKAVEGAGASGVAIHARSATQGYSGMADWDLIKRVAWAVSIPVTGNGDILTAEQALERLEQSGCAMVMIGRSALGAPWIFRRFNELAAGAKQGKITPAQMEAVILQQLEMMVALYTERLAVRKMRSRLGYYTKGMKGGARFRSAVNRQTGFAEMRDLITGFFGKAVCADNI